jgi:hypothetical protein
LLGGEREFSRCDPLVAAYGCLGQSELHRHAPLGRRFNQRACAMDLSGVRARTHGRVVEEASFWGSTRRMPTRCAVNPTYEKATASPEDCLQGLVRRLVRPHASLSGGCSLLLLPRRLAEGVDRRAVQRLAAMTTAATAKATA